MAAERRSLQDLIRHRQRSGFVGRQGQVTQYQENFGFAVDDERRRFLFNIHGDAGVGKSYLARQLQQIATSVGGLTAYIDETVDDVTAAMTTVAEQFARAGARLGEFDKRAEHYRQRRHEMESDAPDGIAAFLTKTAVTIGLAAARDIPVAGSLIAPVDAAATADQVNQARRYLAQRFSDHADTRLLLSPVDELTPIFVAGVNRVAAQRTVALFVDTYERTGLLLDSWLRRMYAGQYGDLPETLITTISGQKPLDLNLWGDYLPVIADIALEPFSDAEARQFLATKGFIDEPMIEVILTLSGRLPLWLVTLAEARPRDSAEIGDPAGNAVERFLKWEDDIERRNIAVVAALPRILNEDVLTAIAPVDKAPELFGWLRGLPFVSQRAGSWAYHEVVRAAMLRLRRAEAPMEWRSAHSALAQMYSGWAFEALGTGRIPWANSERVGYLREATYHLLCADPAANLPSALSSAVTAAEFGTINARQWAELIADAGRDTENPVLRQWGQRLRDGIHDSDLAQYLTCLINDANLGNTTLTAALARRGLAHQLAGRNSQSLDDFARAIELDSSDARVIEQRGDVYLQAGRFGEAITDFSRAIELAPPNGWAVARRGEACRKEGRFGEAITDFSRAIELDPGDAWAVGQRGQAYLQAGRFEEAITDFSRAIELAPPSAWAVARRGEAYREEGCFGEAIADFSRVIELDPGDAWAVGQRGQAYRQAGRFEEAITDLSHVIELDPVCAWAVAQRGEAYRERGCFGEAIADFSRAIELDPAIVWPIGSRGEAYRERGCFGDAITDFSRAIELAPPNAWAVAQRGKAYRQAGRFDEAITDLIRFLELDSGDAWDLSIREAIADFSRAIEADDPRDSEDALRCLVHLMMGEFDEAMADANRVIDADPSDAALRCLVYLAMEECDEAMADANRVIEADPADAFGVTIRAIVYLEMGSFEEAIADLTVALEARPDSASVIGSRGYAHRQIGRFEEAIADLDRAIELNRAITSVVLSSLDLTIEVNSVIASFIFSDPDGIEFIRAIDSIIPSDLKPPNNLEPTVLLPELAKELDTPRSHYVESAATATASQDRLTRRRSGPSPRHPE